YARLGDADAAPDWVDGTKVGFLRKLPSRLNADAVVNSAPKALLAPQVSLGRFHRNVPQQELDLLQFAAGGVAQAGAGAPTIVRRQFCNTSPAGVLLHDVPDHFFGDSLSPNRSLPSHAPEDPPVGDGRRLEGVLCMLAEFLYAIATARIYTSPNY